MVHSIDHLALDLTIQVITYTTLQLANFQLALDLTYTNQNAYKTIQVTQVISLLNLNVNLNSKLYSIWNNLSGFNIGGGTLLWSCPRRLSLTICS